MRGTTLFYFSQAYGHEAGFHYLQAAAIALLGDNLLALRLTAVFGGLLGVAVTFALSKRLFGIQVALLAAGLLAVLFWPVFFSRLGLRAIWLPVVAGLSAIFWWQAWQRATGAGRQGATVNNLEKTASSLRPSASLSFILAGLMAGLSLYTYLAARAVPLFYLLFFVYLILVHRAEFKVRWRGVVWFSVVFFLTALPLFYFVQTNPGAEFRVAEVSQPLTDLLAGKPQPVLENGLKLIAMFGIIGDPLWREGVPDAPVFEPLVALLFYGGVILSLWRWRDGRYTFILLWLGVSLIPSLVTINAPSHIRSINALLVSTIFPAIFIHKFMELSTVFPKLSTKFGKLALTLVLFTFFLLYAARSVNLMLNVWPAGGDVPFVWQTAFAEVAAVLDSSEGTAVALAGWSPETMDSPSMTLLRQHDDVAISHFNPQDGSLIIPPSGQVIRPSALPLDPYWEAQLEKWNAQITTRQYTTQYKLQPANALSPSASAAVQFGDDLLFLGYDVACPPDIQPPCHLVTQWQVTAVPDTPRQLFIHYLDDEGNQIGEAYHFDRQDPQGLWFPHWQTGDLILQHHLLPADTAQMRVGWFDPSSCVEGVCQNLKTEAGAEFWLFEIAPE